MRQLILAGVLGLCALGSCQRHAHDAAHNHAHTHNHTQDACGTEADAHHSPRSSEATHTDEIVLPKDKAEAAGVQVDTIHPQRFCHVFKVAGQILPAPGDEAMVVATVAGVVSLQKGVAEGVQQRAGSTLLTLSSQGMAEGDPVQRARIAYEAAKQEYERQKALLPTRIVSEKEFAQTRQEYENARLGYESLARQHADGRQRITAPLTGYVKSLLVHEGEYVSVGQPLLSLTQNRRLVLRAEVPERYYPYLRQVHSAHFRPAYSDRVYQLDSLGGRLLSYGRTAEQGEFYLPVTFEFDNREGILAGSFVEVYLLGAAQEGVLALPRTALTEEQGTFFVYRQIDEEGYERQEVKPGADNGLLVQIESGIRPGDRIVTHGAIHLRLAGAGNSLPAHSHTH